MSELDFEGIQAFILVADLKSFTRAARSLNTTQSAISLRISRLEKRLDRRLFERTPRLVRLSPAGEAFLAPARNLAEAYQQALGTIADKTLRLTLGLSHHLVCNDLQHLLSPVQNVDPAIVLSLSIGPTRGLLDSYDDGNLDAIIVLRHDESRRGGETLVMETFGWMAAPGFRWDEAGPLPLALQAEPCNLRATTLAALKEARRPWREAFLGASASSLAGAALAGIGVAVMAHRVAPETLVDVGPRYGLPPLSPRPVVLHSNLTDPAAKDLLRRLVVAFRGPRPSQLAQAAE